MRKICLAAILGLALASLGAQELGPRHALVLGNADYANLKSLRNPLNDARDLAGALERLGFTVTLKLNADRRTMNQAIVAFREALAADPRSEGFFYFAGHGVQSSRGQNYLMPVDALVKSETDLEDEAVRAQKILDSLDEARNSVNLVILDACRDNPLPATARSSASRGLAVLSAAPPETIILYSTAAGQTASDGAEGKRNSPFTAALLKHLAAPGDVTQTIKLVTAEVMATTPEKQRPFQYSSLSRDFRLNRSAVPGAGSAQPSAASAGPTSGPGAASASGSGGSAGSAAGSPSLTVTRQNPEVPAPSLTVTTSYGSISIKAARAGSLFLDGKAMGELPAGAVATLNPIEVGERRLELRYAEGYSESLSVTVTKNAVAEARFTGTKPAVSPPTSAAPSAPGTKVYKIGDTGPAGGIVFYDKGSYSDGWRYLEAAPKDQSTSIQWYNGSYIGIKTNIAVGSGRANTEAIIAAQGPGKYAAALCKNLSLGGYSDWFLPSKDELHLMYLNLKKAGLGGFSEGWLWSSSQSNSVSAWAERFSVGVQASSGKDYGYAVLACRAF